MGDFSTKYLSHLGLCLFQIAAFLCCVFKSISLYSHSCLLMGPVLTLPPPSLRQDSILLHTSTPSVSIAFKNPRCCEPGDTAQMYSRCCNLLATKEQRQRAESQVVVHCLPVLCFQDTRKAMLGRQQPPKTSERFAHVTPCISQRSRLQTLTPPLCKSEHGPRSIT